MVENTPTRPMPLADRPVNVQNRNQQQHLTPTRTADEDEGSEYDQNDTIEDDSSSLVSSCLSTTTSDTTPARKPTKAELRAQKKAKKSHKSQTKALKNQGRGLLLATVTLTDIDRVAKILHGEQAPGYEPNSAHPLATDTTIEDVINRNLGFVKHIESHKAYLFKSIAQGRKETKERKRLKRKEHKGEYEDIQTEEVVTAVLVKLGISLGTTSSSGGGGGCSSSSSSVSSINTNGGGGRNRKRANSVASTNITALVSSPFNKNDGSMTTTPKPKSNKSKTAIVTKLRDLIKDDLEKHENEVRGTYVRAGGFWRYVGKTVFERMTEIARTIDVESGERWDKKMKRERMLNGTATPAAAGLAAREFERDGNNRDVDGDDSGDGAVDEYDVDEDGEELQG